jgi:hypothetical protein
MHGYGVKRLPAFPLNIFIDSSDSRLGAGRIMSSSGVRAKGDSVSSDGVLLTFHRTVRMGIQSMANALQQSLADQPRKRGTGQCLRVGSRGRRSPRRAARSRARLTLNVFYWVMGRRESLGLRAGRRELGAEAASRFTGTPLAPHDLIIQPRLKTKIPPQGWHFYRLVEAAGIANLHHIPYNLLILKQVISIFRSVAQLWDTGLGYVTGL